MTDIDAATSWLAKPTTPTPTLSRRELTAQGLNARGRRLPRMERRPCGTRAAYRRHLKRREVTDAKCCAAEATYQRERRQARAQVQR